MTTFRDLDRDEQLDVVMADINRPTAIELRREFAFLLRAAADKAAEHWAAARAEWDPFSQAYADIDDMPPEADGPFAEWLLARMQVERVLERYARLFAVDEPPRATMSDTEALCVATIDARVERQQ